LPFTKLVIKGIKQFDKIFLLIKNRQILSNISTKVSGILRKVISKKFLGLHSVLIIYWKYKNYIEQLSVVPANNLYQIKQLKEEK
jgi:hypothetical protein